MSDFDKNALASLVAKYRPHGEIKAGELALPLAIALDFARELATLGVVVDGLSGWYRWDKDPSVLGEDVDVAATGGIPDSILGAPNAPQRSFEWVRDYIEHRLPQRVTLVSFGLFNVPSGWRQQLFGEN